MISKKPQQVYALIAQKGCQKLANTLTCQLKTKEHHHAHSMNNGDFAKKGVHSMIKTLTLFLKKQLSIGLL